MEHHNKFWVDTGKIEHGYKVFECDGREKFFGPARTTGNLHSLSLAKGMRKDAMTDEAEAMAALLRRAVMTDGSLPLPGQLIEEIQAVLDRAVGIVAP